jgi:hypothetical protein
VAVRSVDLDEAPVRLRDGELLEQRLEPRLQERRRPAGLDRQIDCDPIRCPELEMRQPRARRRHHSRDLAPHGSQLVRADACRPPLGPPEAQRSAVGDREDEDARQVGFSRAVTERAADHPRLPLTAAVSASGLPVPGECRVELDVARLERMPVGLHRADPKLRDPRGAHRPHDPAKQRALLARPTRDGRVDTGRRRNRRHLRPSGRSGGVTLAARGRRRHEE